MFLLCCASYDCLSFGNICFENWHHTFFWLQEHRGGYCWCHVPYAYSLTPPKLISSEKFATIIKKNHWNYDLKVNICLICIKLKTNVKRFYSTTNIILVDWHKTLQCVWKCRYLCYVIISGNTPCKLITVK